MRRIANILTTVVFLISFIGIQVNKHYSQGKLYDVSVFNEAESCCDISEMCEIENMGVGQCEHKSNHDLSCKTTTEVFKLHDNFISEKYSSPNISSINLFIVTAFSSAESLYSVNLVKSTSYSMPPKLVCDYQAELGTFLC